MNKKILITGGSGMVGKNLVSHACKKGFIVVSPGSDELNLCDYEATLKYIDKINPVTIIHCAGKVGGIQANIKNPVRFLVENWDMGRNIVLAASQVGVPQLINLGSSCMYPRNSEKPLIEDDVLTGQLEPTNEGYALAKCSVAKLCQYLQIENPSIQYKTLIPSNLYGPFDKFNPMHSHLIPAIIHKLHMARVNNFPEVEIWGDGFARREFMFVGDLSDAIVRALQNYDTLPSLLNIGLGYDYSVNEYYNVAAEVIGYKGKFTHDLSKPVGMKRKLVDVTRAKEWGWQSQTLLMDGLKKTYEYYLTLGDIE